MMKKLGFRPDCWSLIECGLLLMFLQMECRRCGQGRRPSLARKCRYGALQASSSGHSAAILALSGMHQGLALQPAGSAKDTLMWLRPSTLLARCGRLLRASALLDGRSGDSMVTAGCLCLGSP